MPINLDFVGLNTLVREEIDTDTNTIGKIKVRAINVPEFTDNYNKAGLSNENLEGYSVTEISNCFWAKIDKDKNQNQHIWSDLSNAGAVQNTRVFFNLPNVYFVVYNSAHSAYKQWAWAVGDLELINFNHFAL